MKMLIMNKDLSVILLASLFGLSCYGMEHYADVFAAALHSLNDIGKNARNGDIDSSIAVYDFQHKLRDADYKIDHQGSINILQKFNLIDHNGAIFVEVRMAFETYQKKSE